MALWSILAAPLLAGNDLPSMTTETLEILTNPEVIAVDQDRLRVQGHRVWEEGALEVWMKPLADGSKAGGFSTEAREAYPFRSVSQTLKSAVQLTSAICGLRKTWVPLTKATLPTFRNMVLY